MNLFDIRQQIDQIDQNLLALIAKRHNLAYKIAEIKAEANLPLRDVNREQALLQKLIMLSHQNHYGLNSQYITQLFKQIIEDSLLTQQSYLENKK